MFKKAAYLFLFLSLIFLFACNNEGADNTEEQNKSEDSSSTKQDEQIVLKVADAFPNTHPVSEHGATFFMDRVEELSDNRVSFEYYPAEQLGDANSLLDLVQTKTTDIAYVGAGYVTDKMPLLGVSQLPGLYQTSMEGSTAYWELVNDEVMESEFKENKVKPVFVNASPPYQITTTSKKIETIEDFKGLRVRTTGGIQDITASALGLVPVQMAGGEIYTALERNTIEGALLAFSSWPAYQFNEVLNYATTNVPLGSAAVTYLINQEVFDNLPTDIQEIIIQVGEETVRNLADVGDEGEKTLSNGFSEDGVDIYEMDESELSEINAELSNVWEEWYAPLNEKGVPAKDVLDKYLELLDK